MGNRGGSDHGGRAQTGGIGSHVHIKATWSADGRQLTVHVNGNQHSGEGFADVMASPGAIIYSSQWTGWVPGNCGGDGNLGASSFSVSNMKIQGRVVQGPEPARCSGPAPQPNPSPRPNPAPRPAPGPRPGPGPWTPCTGPICCNPNAAIPQYCPGGIRCQQCGGGAACQCPPRLANQTAAAIVV